MRILWSSDHHLLHSNTPTKHILNNLNKFFYRDNDLTNVDMIVFGGDFLDKLVDCPNSDMFDTHAWVRDFLDKCNKANPKMTVIWLEGTSSHDWGQPKTFLNLAPEGLDVRYIDTVRIDTYQQYHDLTVLHIPDNMGSLTPDQIWELALEALSKKGLTQVDLIFFHGGFEEQLHPKARKHAHNLERWCSIVKYGLFSGHIHKPFQRDKVYTSGSFDRTAHGEEHPKGAYVIELDKTKDYFYPRFHENKDALPYLTLTVTKEDGPEDVLTKLKAFIQTKNPRVNSQIKIKGGIATVVNPILRVITREYPNYGFKAENESLNEEAISEELFDATLYESKSITKENIITSIVPEIKPMLDMRGLDVKDAIEVLEGFL